MDRTCVPVDIDPWIPNQPIKGWGVYVGDFLRSKSKTEGRGPRFFVHILQDYNVLLFENIELQILRRGRLRVRDLVFQSHYSSLIKANFQVQLLWAKHASIKS